jgi:metallo-beta-lactamase family protein
MNTLTFLGAAGTVTGSKHLLEVSGTRVLVDCGLFQGLKELRQRNWAPLPIDPSSIHAVALTHAHLDHCGYLPRLVANGFKGRIFCTGATADLCRIVLPDAAKLQEEDAENANRQGYSRHAPALPLFTSEDAAQALTMLQPVGYERAMPLAPGIQLEYVNAGHLLGSAYASVRTDGLHVLFGGDLGRYNRPVLPDPSPVAEADVLLVESTYGNRTHPAEDDGEVLAEIVRSTAEKRGRVVVPSFAIGRVEELLYWIKRLEDEKRIPVLPVWVDSPMAASALRHYAARVDELDPELRTSERAPKELRAVAAFATDRLKIVSSPQESRDLVASRVPAIVISSSGMATGGRVLNHLRQALPRPENTVLFVGFQAAGTRGRQLIEGAHTVRIQGSDVPVNARVETLNSMSAHADRTEILRWLRNFRRPPSRTFIVHGEPDASAALKEEIARELEWTADIAGYLQKIELAPAR